MVCLARVLAAKARDYSKGGAGIMSAAATFPCGEDDGFTVTPAALEAFNKHGYIIVR